jgi:hypothetical protein
MGFRDLPPSKDPKAGSPKTPPRPISQREFQAAVESGEVPPIHNWEHRGISPPQNGSKYFSGILLRYIVSFLLGVVSTSFFLGGKSRDLSELLVWKGTVNSLSNEWKASIDSEISRMNREGTNASKMKVDQESKQIQGNSESITDLYRKVEPIGAMQAKIERLQHDIDAKK